MIPRLALLTLLIAVLVPSAGLPSSPPSALSAAPALSAPSVTSAASATSAPSALSAPSAASAASAAHALNRLAFGPRPGDLERVQRMGVLAWIEQQLQPERIDNRALDARLAAFETLTLDTGSIVREYHQPAVAERRQRQQQNATAPNAEAPEPLMSGDRARPDRAQERAPQSEAQRKNRLILTELSEARLLRAIYSERQLEEILTDFWFNHFNVFAGKGPTRAYLTSFERDAIRPHVLGDFRTMVEAVAQSPAMLFYLDNWQNVAPQMGPRAAQAGPARTQARQRPQAEQGQRPARGINENFARELLELHTLGVDGGYTQEDIVNVARAFTGWTMRPRQEAAFVFAPAMHDRDAKTVLGRTIAAGGGIEDGRQVLDILVAHPSTARFIATKLAQKFVSDAPPPALVERAARRFHDTRGNLREVTRAIVTSPEFLAADAYRAKVKTPLEFIASALRATGAEVRSALPVTRTLRDLGMPLYFCQPPTGYNEAADTWVSSGALVARMNFALALGGHGLRGISLPQPGASVDGLRERLLHDALGGEVSQATRATVAKATTADQVVALVIGSPEFQRQ